jgi:hypothetical protein
MVVAGQIPRPAMQPGVRVNLDRGHAGQADAQPRQASYS